VTVCDPGGTGTNAELPAAITAGCGGPQTISAVAGVGGRVEDAFNLD